MLSVKGNGIKQDITVTTENAVKSILNKAKRNISLLSSSREEYPTINGESDTDVESDESDVETYRTSRWKSLYGNRSSYDTYNTTISINCQPTSPNFSDNEDEVELTLTPSPNLLRREVCKSSDKKDPIERWSSKVRDVSRHAMHDVLHGIGVKPPPSFSPTEHDKENDKWNDELMNTARRLVHECTRRDRAVSKEAQRIKYEVKGVRNVKRQEKLYDPRLVMEERHRAIRLRREKRKEEQRRKNMREQELKEREEKKQRKIQALKKQKQERYIRRKEQERELRRKEMEADALRKSVNFFHHYHSMLLQKGWKKLKKNVYDAKERLRKVEKFQSMTQRRLQGAFFQLWKKCYKKSAEKRTKTKLVLERKLETLHQLRLVKKLFKAWKVLYGKLQEKKGRARNYLKWSIHSKYFDRLREYTNLMKIERDKARYKIRLKEEREKEQKADKHHVSKTKSIYFAMWLWLARKQREDKIVMKQHSERKQKINRILERMKSSQSEERKEEYEHKVHRVESSSPKESDYTSTETEQKHSTDISPVATETVSEPTFLQKMESRALERRNRRKMIKERNLERVRNMKLDREKRRLLREMEEEQKHLKIIEEKRQESLEKRRRKALIKTREHNRKLRFQKLNAVARAHRHISTMKVYGWRPWRKLMTVKRNHFVKSSNHYRISLMEKAWEKFMFLYSERKTRERKRMMKLECLGRGFRRRSLRKKVFSILRSNLEKMKKRMRIVGRSRDLDVKQKIFNEWTAVTIISLSDQRQKMEIADIHARPIILKKTMLKFARNVLIARNNRAKEMRQAELRERAMRYMSAHK